MSLTRDSPVTRLDHAGVHVRVEFWKRVAMRVAVGVGDKAHVDSWKGRAELDCRGTEPADLASVEALHPEGTASGQGKVGDAVLVRQRDRWAAWDGCRAKGGRGSGNIDLEPMFALWDSSGA